MWGGTSAPKVFLATTEKMSLYTTNILRVSCKVALRGLDEKKCHFKKKIIQYMKDVRDGLPAAAAICNTAMALQCLTHV